jgi:hypothetical protein
MADEILKEMWRLKDAYGARFESLREMVLHLQQKERDSGREYVHIVRGRKRRILGNTKKRNAS